MPVYNAEKYVRECIESVINQTCESWELLLVNDGSTDGSLEICKSFLGDERISVFSKKNEGLSATRNYGLSRAKGDYILFLDSDDTIEPDSLERFQSIINKTGAEVIAGYAYHFDLRVRGEDDLFVRCIAAVEAALRDRFPEDEPVLYDDGKYVLRSLERYAGERLPAPRVGLLPECLDSSFLPPDSCTPGYDYLIRKVLSEAFESRDASFAPISYLKNEYQFESSSEIEACRFASTIALYAATYGSGDEANDKDYGCPGGFDGERIETMEDLFLLTVFQIYTKLLLPNEG